MLSPLYQRTHTKPWYITALYMGIITLCIQDVDKRKNVDGSKALLLGLCTNNSLASRGRALLGQFL